MAASCRWATRRRQICRPQWTSSTSAAGRSCRDSSTPTSTAWIRPIASATTRWTWRARARFEGSRKCWPGTEAVPEGQWITAIGAANPNLWAEHRMPTLKELDDAVPDRPVLLYQGFNGAAATNTLGKRFFDAADAAPPLHPDYIRVNVSDTGAIGASTAKGGPSTSALYLLRRLQTFEDRKRERAAHDGVLDEPRPDGLARQVDHLRARRRCTRVRGRRPSTPIGPATPGTRSTTKAGCRCGCRWTSRPSPSSTTTRC